MRKLKPQPLRKLLSDRQNSAARLMEHGAWLKQLNTAVHALLPESCRAHCRVANVRDGVLALAADTPAWAARLRFHGPHLRRSLERQTTLQVDDIRVLVVPRENRMERSRMARPDLSRKSAGLLRDTAEAMDDPLLRTALLRLADRGRSGEDP